MDCYLCLKEEIKHWECVIIDRITHALGTERERLVQKQTRRMKNTKNTWAGGRQKRNEKF